MSQMRDSLGDRMKSYEAVTRSTLLPHSFTIIRVDGRAFHSYLKGARRPFDFDFMDDMEAVGKGLCKEISGTVFAYGQSDEISLLLSDIEPQSQPWFGGVVQKMASVSASLATMFLIQQRGIKGFPTFDSRVFTLPSLIEVGNYFLWRQRDAVRNSILMAGQSLFPHKLLHGKNTDQIQEMLFQEGINWNDYPDVAKRGWVLTKEVEEGEVKYVHKLTKEEESTTAMRTYWKVSSPHLTVDSPLFLWRGAGKAVSEWLVPSL